MLEYNGSNVVQRRYVHGSNIEADDPLVWYEGSAGTGTGRRFVHADPRGSIVAVTDYLGNAIATNAYDEFGIPDTASGGATDIATKGRFRYTGQVWLPELGMYYYKARVYSPTLGRFLQTDPIGYEDQYNLYAYVANDPINAVDPDGLQDRKLEQNYVRPRMTEEQRAQVDVVEDANSESAAIGIGIGATLALPGPEDLAIAAAAATKFGQAIKGLFTSSKAAPAPSTLSPGPNARESIPAQQGRPTAAQQREINRIGDENGCHTCGTRDSGRQSGNWTGDHQPPTALNPSGGPQRFYPHCAGCSARQGAEVRNVNRGNRPPAQSRRPEDR